MRHAILLLLFAVSVAANAATNDFEKWEADIQKFEAADRAQTPPKGALLFVGSSSIRLWTNLTATFQNHKIVQRGFGGSTMADALHFADRIILPYEPKKIFVYEGDNDLAAGKEPETIVNEFKQLTQKINARLPETKVAFIAVKPSPSRWKLEARQRAVNDAIVQLARENPRIEFIDIWSPMLGDDGKPRAELFVKDNLHLNEKGYAVWAEVIRKHLP